MKRLLAWLRGRGGAEPAPRVELRAFAGEQIGPYRVRRLIAENAAGAVLQVEEGLLKLWLDGAASETDRAALQQHAETHATRCLRVLQAGVLEARDFYILQAWPGPPLAEDPTLPRPSDMAGRLETAATVCETLAGAVPHVPLLFSAGQLFDGGRLVDGIGAPLAPPGREAALARAQVPLSRRYPWPVPPELVAGKPLDARTRVWCLGHLLYELVVGAVPFPGLDPSMLAMAPVLQDPLPPRQINRAVPAAFERLLLRMLHRDPASRPPLSDVAWP